MATDIFQTNHFFGWVGGRNAKLGGPNNGGATKEWFDANYNVDASIMGVNGAALIATVNNESTDHNILEGATAGTFDFAEAGMVAYLSGTGVVTGRYEILASPGDGTLQFPTNTFVPTGETDITCNVGGAFENLQQALDATDASAKNVTIYTNKDETLAAQVDFDTGLPTLATGTRKDIICYKITAGDCSKGGEFYGGALDAYKKEKGFTMDNPNAYWVTFTTAVADTNCFEYDNCDNIGLENAKIICGANKNGVNYSANGVGGNNFINCVFDNYRYAIFSVSSYFGMLVDDCYMFKGSGNGWRFIIGSAFASMIENNIFENSSAASGMFATYGTIRNNLFIGGDEAIDTSSSVLIINNTFYAQTTQAIQVATTTVGQAIILNNIFYMADKADVAINVDANQGTYYENYNCFYAIEDGGNGAPVALTNPVLDDNGNQSVNYHGNSIEQNPLLVDAANGDFSLLPTSPCLNTGQLLGGGLSSMGWVSMLGPPSAPTISSVVDDGNEDSITVTVAGSGTIQLYYREKYAASWTIGQTRSGSGDIVQTGLTAGTWYELYITDTVNLIESGPSTVSVVRVLDSSDTSIEGALVAILEGDATVNSLVGTKIFPNKVPQGTAMPAITYQQISGPRDHVMAGPTGLVDARYQFNCWSDKYAQAKEVFEAVRIILDGYSGTVNSRQIDGIRLENEGDVPQVAPGKDQLMRYGKRFDAVVPYQESIT